MGMKSEVFNIDCMEGMKDIPDNYYDLAVVDPPYGIGINKQTMGRGSGNDLGKHIAKEWDNKIPDAGYFYTLARISKHQIIWGGNYFTDHLPAGRGWIVWRKFTEEAVYSDVELCWTSFDRVAKLFEYRWNGMLQGDMKNKEIRIHPTQKPVALYKWLLKNYAKEGDKILDTHLGSQSSRIAAHDMGFDFTGYEIDKDYYEAAEKRFQNHIQQGTIFEPKDMYQ